jgi:Family of unknown function (DUF6152)
MKRRCLVLSLAALPLAARAHHGWSSFDLARPIYLAGRAANVSWRNPHVELDLDVAPDLKLPPDLAQRAVPAQAAAVDGPALLKAAQLPTRKDKRWHIELAPLSRMQAWQTPEVKNGDTVQVLGFTFAGEKGEPILRGEYVWVGGKPYGLRSAPA